MKIIGFRTADLTQFQGEERERRAELKGTLRAARCPAERRRSHCHPARPQRSLCGSLPALTAPPVLCPCAAGLCRSGPSRSQRPGHLGQMQEPGLPQRNEKNLSLCHCACALFVREVDTLAADFSITGEVKLNSDPAESHEQVDSGRRPAHRGLCQESCIQPAKRGQERSGLQPQHGKLSDQLQVMLGDEQLAAEKLEEIRRMAASTPFSLSDLTEGTQTLSSSASRRTTPPAY